MTFTPMCPLFGLPKGREVSLLRVTQGFWVDLGLEGGL